MSVEQDILPLADKLDKALVAVANGQMKADNIPLVPIIRLIAYARTTEQTLQELEAKFGELVKFQGQAPAMAETIANLQNEAAHWKANHTHEVERARLIKNRTDLPLERANAYDRCALDKVEGLKAIIAELCNDAARVIAVSDRDTLEYKNLKWTIGKAEQLV